MKLVVTSSSDQLGARAAADGARFIRDAVREKGCAAIIVATGASQFDVLHHLVREEVDWSRVTAFHLDEYLDLPATHPASFRRYLKERLVDRVSLRQFHYVNGESGRPEEECDRLGALIARHPVDVAFVGIGENGHLAFNDPPADFDTETPYLVVELDEACRRQQLGEGWFSSLAEVPTRAISMSVRQIMKTRFILCSVPDERKARAVRSAVEGRVSPSVPASILQEHPACTLYLDGPAASLLSPSTLG